MANSGRTPVSGDGESFAYLTNLGLRTLPRRDFLRLTMGASAALLAASCSFGSQPKTSGELRVAVPSLGNETWVQRNTNTDQRMVWAQLGDVLYGVNRQDGISFDPREGLLDEYTVNAQGTKVTLTLKIKKGIHFHFNEGILTANDVKFTYLEFLRAGSVHPDAATFKKMINGDPTNLVVVDDQTLQFNMDVSWVPPGMQHLFTNAISGNWDAIEPMAYMQRVGEAAFEKKPISTGPWQWGSWISGQSVTLHAVHNHWRQSPAFDTLTITKVPDPATRLSMLLAGEVDITDLSPLQVAQAQQSSRVRVWHYNAGADVRLALGGIVLKGATTKHANIYNPKIPWVGEDPLDPGPLAVRTAMDLAIDRTAIVNALLKGLGSPAALPFGWDTPGAPWYDTAWKPRPYQPDQARQLMQQAGFAKGFTMDAWVFALSNGPQNGDIMTAVAGYWQKELNIQVNLHQAEYNPTVRQHFFDRSFGEYAFTYTGTGISLPYSNIPNVMSSTSALAYFEVAEFEQIAAQLTGQLDQAKIDAITKQAGDFVYQNHVMSTIAYVHTVWGINKQKIKDWNRTASQTWVGGLEYVTKA